MKRNQWAAAVLAIFLFCGGAAIGALADHFYTIRTVNAKNAEDLRRRYIDETRTRCNLTPEQVTQLQAILDDTKAKVKALRDAYHPQMLKIHNEQVARVKSILRPDQIPAYEQLVAERQRRAPR